jgi:uncharacterized protein with PIN domain
VIVEEAKDLEPGADKCPQDGQELVAIAQLKNAAGETTGIFYRCPVCRQLYYQPAQAKIQQ